MSRLQNMTLQQKGPIQPPVRLEGFAQKTSRAVQAMQNVTSATHWEIDDQTAPDGADFYLGSRELGHIHLDGEAHIPVTKKIAEWLIRYEIAEAFPYSDAWITFQISSRASAKVATQLFALNHARVSGASSTDLRSRLEAIRALTNSGTRV